MVHATPAVKNNIDSEVEVTSWKRKERVVDRVLLLRLDLFFFLSVFSFTHIHESQDCRGRGRAIF